MRRPVVRGPPRRGPAAAHTCRNTLAQDRDSTASSRQAAGRPSRGPSRRCTCRRSPCSSWPGVPSCLRAQKCRPGRPGPRPGRRSTACSPIRWSPRKPPAPMPACSTRTCLRRRECRRNNRQTLWNLRRGRRARSRWPRASGRSLHGPEHGRTSGPCLFAGTGTARYA